MSCRDGFRWGPDSKRLVFWRVDARFIKNHLMINNTGSLYPFTIPVEYPKAGEKPSAVTIGVVQIKNKKTTWLQIPGEADNNYLPRLEWVDAEDIMVAQVNRKQQEARLYSCSPSTGRATLIYQESDPAWIAVDKPFIWDDLPWKWINNKQEFLWSSEQDGWQHIYKISRDGKRRVIEKLEGALVPDRIELARMPDTEPALAVGEVGSPFGDIRFLGSFDFLKGAKLRSAEVGVDARPVLLGLHEVPGGIDPSGRDPIVRAPRAARG